MSKPRYWWYDYVKKSIRHSMSRINSGTEPATLQEAQATFATRKALDELKNKDRAPEREEFTRKLFSSQKYTAPGLAMQMCISETTASNWKMEFVYQVAFFMGFL